MMELFGYNITSIVLDIIFLCKLTTFVIETHPEITKLLNLVVVVK